MWLVRSSKLHLCPVNPDSSLSSNLYISPLKGRRREANVSPLMKQHHVRSLDNKYVRVNYRTEKSDIEVYKTNSNCLFLLKKKQIIAFSVEETTFSVQN